MHRLVSDDVRSQLHMTLIRKDTSNPVNLSGLEVKMKIRARNTNTVLVTISADIVTPQDGEILFPLKDLLAERAAGYYEGEVYTEDVNGKEIVYELVNFQVRESF